MMDSYASFIVPVYNDEKYIERCLTSIKNQVYENWEAIIVDDGSTDESPKIIDKFEEKDSRFRIFHKNWGGYRQLGIMAFRMQKANSYSSWMEMIG
jgi:glycosyltransferase involved in cell wall biosynthesis